MTDTTVQKKTYMTGLDGLRAVAVSVVIAYHLNLPFALGGFLGVTLFFVLSGYLITDLILSEWQREGEISFKRFFVRRAKRLLPGVLFLLIFLAAYATIFQPELLVSLKSDILPSMFFFSNWWSIFNGVSYFEAYLNPSLLTHFWSLAVEAQFYLLWPFIILIVQRFIKKKWLNIALMALFALASAVWMAVLFRQGSDISRIYYGTDTRAFSLLLGALFAYVCPSAKILCATRKNRVHIPLDIIGFASLGLVLFMCYHITQYDDYLYFGGMFVFSLICVFLIAAVASPHTIIGKVFSLKPLRYLGKISYGIYLWHFPVITVTGTIIQTTKINAGLCIIEVAASVLLASISYYLIENPIQRNSIFTSLKSESFRGFCANCRVAHWRSKATALMVMTLIVASSVGFVRVAPETAGVDEALSSQAGTVVVAPLENSLEGMAIQSSDDTGQSQELPISSSSSQPQIIIAISDDAYVTVSVTQLPVLVDGEQQQFEAYLIDNSNYFKIRDIAYVLNGTAKQFGVNWDNWNNAVTITTGESYISVGGELEGAGDNGIMSVSVSADNVYLNGESVSLATYNINGSNYVKLRDLAVAVDFGVIYSEERNAIEIDTCQNYIPSPEEQAALEAALAERELDVTLIGDSVGVNLAPYLQEYYPNLYVDAEVSRQFSAAEDIAEALIQNDKLGSVVVIELGTNGTIKESHMRSLIETIGSDRKIVFINIQVPRSWCEGNNETLAEVTAEYDNAIVADWYALSLNHGEYFLKDGVHTTTTGSSVLTALLHDVISGSNTVIFASGEAAPELGETVTCGR